MIKSISRDKPFRPAELRARAAMAKKGTRPSTRATQPVGNRPIEQHWSVISETLAPVTVLMQYLQSGWAPQSPVTVGVFPFGASRSIKVYYFVLVKPDSRPLWIPVLSNPVVTRLLQQYRLGTREIQSCRGEDAQPSIDAIAWTHDIDCNEEAVKDD